MMKFTGRLQEQRISIMLVSHGEVNHDGHNETCQEILGFRLHKQLFIDKLVKKLCKENSTENLMNDACL